MLAIFKPGQGFYTRVCSAVGISLLSLMGVAWITKFFAGSRLFGQEPIFTQALVAVLVLALIGAVCFWLIGVKPRSVDFLIATEGEMKKVNWSTRKEVTGSTTLVIGFTFFLAALCFLLDYVFAVILQWVHVLEAK